MKYLLLMSVFLGSLSVFAQDLAYDCKNTQIFVDKIVKNEAITGHVRGLPTNVINNYKVVFYVKTNRWYVHPYKYQPNQEAGLSFAKLNANGEYSIKTLRRDVPAKKMVAILVPNNYTIKSESVRLHPLFGRFGGLLKNYCSYTTVQGNGDFFVE